MLKNKEEKTPIKTEKVEKTKKIPEVIESPVSEKRRRTGTKNKRLEEEELEAEPVNQLPERKKRKTIETSTPLLKPSRLRLPAESPSKQTPEKVEQKVFIFVKTLFTDH